MAPETHSGTAPTDPPALAAPVQHFWNDPDGDGHNCVDCDSLSIWRCDQAAHLPVPTPTASESLKKKLTDAARSRRGIAPPNKGLA